MRVMVIIKANKESEAGILDNEIMEEMGKFNDELIAAGIMQAGEGLKPSSAGARVHFSGKDRRVIDGPFAETKELIAGFWLWKVDSLQHAIDWVKRCPSPMKAESYIEIRPIFELEDFGDQISPELRDKEVRQRAELEAQQAKK